MQKQINRERNHELRIIFATAKRLGLSHEMIHEVNHRINGIASISALDEPQRTKLIKELFRLGRRKRQPVARNVISLISSAQQGFIAQLLRDLGWAANPTRYENFCKKVIKKPAPQTTYEAEKIIEAFKAMIKRNYGSDDLAGGRA